MFTRDMPLIIRVQRENLNGKQKKTPDKAGV
jgi:hypothetical protein